MMAWFSRLSLNQRLALLAVLLGAVALFARPTRGGSVHVDPRELALGVEREADHVKPAVLADWIIAGRSDYRLIDVRDERAYAVYHIPTAESLPLTSLGASELARNETIVVYSDSDLHTAQAWFVLRAAGYAGVRTLDGGLDGWKGEVLYPVVQGGVPALPQAEIERRTTVSRFFGGNPRVASAAQIADVAAPDGQAPAAAPKVELPRGAKPAAAPKKKKEGC